MYLCVSTVPGLPQAPAFFTMSLKEKPFEVENSSYNTFDCVFLAEDFTHLRDWNEDFFLDACGS